MASCARSREKVFAGADSGGGSALPPRQWELRGGALRAPAWVSKSLALSGELRRHQFGAFVELDFGVATRPGRGHACAPVADNCGGGIVIVRGCYWQAFAVVSRCFPVMSASFFLPDFLPDD